MQRSDTKEIEARMERQIEPRVFWPALTVILTLCFSAMAWPEASAVVVNNARNWVGYNFGWLYLFSGIACFGLLGWLSLGQFATVKLGRPDDEPEFSTFTWIAMLFCGGIGSSLTYWALLEPIYYLQTPPFALETGSAPAYEWAAMYGNFHWGISAWAFWAVPAIVIGYSYYVRRQPRLTFSMASQSVLGRHATGPLGIAMDVAVMFGIIGGVGTSLGLGTPLIAAISAKILGIQQSVGLNLVILLIWTLIFGTSVYLGLERGIARLSNINTYLALLLVAFALVVGPTVFILNTFSNSMGLMMNNFFRMSLWTDPIAQDGFPQTWTVFYWAWWVAYAPMMGLFVARISRGRTFREIIFAMCFWGSVGCWAYFAVFGGYSLHLQVTGALDVSRLLTEVGPAETGATILASLPMSGVVLPTIVVVLFIFMATTIDSSAYILASVSTRELRADEEPARWNRVLWAVVLGLTAMMMLAIGGLEAIQASSIVMALPVLVSLFVLVWAFVKDLHEDYGEALAPPPLPVVEYEEGGRRLGDDSTQG
jgi:BCCT family betaine/carnitine transporter